MTFGEAREAWSRIDRSVWFGVAMYLFLSRRDLRRRLLLAERTVRIQEAVIQSMISAARLCGFVLFDPRHGDDGDPDRPERLH